MADPITNTLQRMMKRRAAAQRSANPETGIHHRAAPGLFRTRARLTLAKFNVKPVTPFKPVTASNRRGTGNFVPSVKLDRTMIRDHRGMKARSARGRLMATKR